MPRRFCKFTPLFLVGTLFACAAGVGAGKCVIPRHQHAWGSFKVGSWKQVRVTYKDYDEDGQLISTSTRDTITTLTAVGPDSYTLLVDVIVHVSGRKFESEPREITLRYDGDSSGEMISFAMVGDDNLKIVDKEIPVSVRKIVVNGGATKRTSIVHYSDSVAPYVLKRETKTEVADEPQSTTTVEVESLSKDYEFEGTNRQAAHIRTVTKTADKTIDTLEYYCADVPGGVVYHESKETDNDGNLMRVSELEIVDYGVDSLVVRRGIFGRKRWRKAQRKAN